MIVKTRIAGVLLAAGEGSRLGSPKALVELGGIRLVDRGIALLRDGGTAPVVAVTGAAVVDLLGVITVHNPDWRSGMGSSLAVGLGSVPAIGPDGVGYLKQVTEYHNNILSPLDPDEIGVDLTYHDPIPRENIAQKTIASAIELAYGDYLIACP